jgi:hypothetical protein
MSGIFDIGPESAANRCPESALDAGLNYDRATEPPFDQYRRNSNRS